MLRSTGLAVAGASLLVAGASMALGAVESYTTSVPRLPWMLYVYEPLGIALFIFGAIVLIRAQRLYDSGKRPTA